MVDRYLRVQSVSSVVFFLFSTIYNYSREIYNPFALSQSFLKGYGGRVIEQLAQTHFESLAQRPLVCVLWSYADSAISMIRVIPVIDF
jgi:hypothetical protein